jgi:hypothetical protein
MTIGTMDAYLAEPGTEGRHSGVVLAPRTVPSLQETSLLSWPASSTQRRGHRARRPPSLTDLQVTAGLQVHPESPQGTETARAPGPVAGSHSGTVNVTDGEYPVHPNTERHPPNADCAPSSRWRGRGAGPTSLARTVHFPRFRFSAVISAAMAG